LDPHKERARQRRRIQCAVGGCARPHPERRQLWRTDETIGNLDGIGRALPTALGVRPGTIADDDLDARVTAQPVGKHIGGAIVEQVNRTMGLEVDQ
jgi:hypothetical protein